MNQRNVDALAAALLSSGLAMGEPWARVLARHLAEQGALVPSTLTDEECLRIGDDPMVTAFLPTMLEHVAKGEPLYYDHSSAKGETP